MNERLAALESLRDLLQSRIVANEDGAQTAALARQYRETLREIEELAKGVKKGSLVDELAKRRNDTRRSATASRKATGERSKKPGA